LKEGTFEKGISDRDRSPTSTVGPLETVGPFRKLPGQDVFYKVEDAEYGIKPMNCLAHMLIYKSRFEATGIFPFVISNSERFTVMKNRENSMAAPVRGFTQDDAHILCRLTAQ